MRKDAFRSAMELIGRHWHRKHDLPNRQGESKAKHANLGVAQVRDDRHNIKQSEADEGQCA